MATALHLFGVWRHDEDQFEDWCMGRTGVPIVDAGMRQVAQTGWMHNLVRMITAMFLTKDLFTHCAGGALLHAPPC